MPAGEILGTGCQKLVHALNWGFAHFKNFPGWDFIVHPSVLPSHDRGFSRVGALAVSRQRELSSITLGFSSLNYDNDLKPWSTIRYPTGFDILQDYLTNF